MKQRLGLSVEVCLSGRKGGWKGGGLGGSDDLSYDCQDTMRQLQGRRV